MGSRTERSRAGQETLLLKQHRGQKMATKAVRLAPGLKEIRLHLCQKSAASTGAREFVEKFYVPLKTANPGHPILIRECSGIQPRVWARFSYGREESVDLSNRKSEDVLDIISKLQ